MTTFCTLFSGSSGNSAFLGTDRTAFLIDCGMSGKQMLEAIELAKVNERAIVGIILTHEHSDHVKGAGIYARKLDIPLYASEGTWAAVKSSLGPLPRNHCIPLVPGESFFLNEWEIIPFPTPHDATQPVGYRFLGPADVSIVTDLGHFSPAVQDAVCGTDLVLLESNYDPEMLNNNANYPQSLKNRIVGRKGHLSNQECAEAAIWMAQHGTSHFLLGHLSGENNLPDLAYQTTHDALQNAGFAVGQDVSLHVAGRYHPSRVYVIR